ncbi:hypothetical protein L2747_07400 [Shewanella marinintestina]|uniref:hypothetical protein n=1 Tax=Shewanella marinintestina TaxID=190305 RepID=UPI00200BDD00|nr:hypothetical protein [Shewanella marinintestina]
MDKKYALYLSQGSFAKVNVMRQTYLTRIFFVSLLSSSFLAIGAYAKNDKHDKGQGKPAKELPYGLQKKAAHGEPLPPGWQKKLKRGDRLSDELYSRGKINSPIDKNGNIVIDIDNTPIKINHKTREIINILVKNN